MDLTMREEPLDSPGAAAMIAGFEADIAELYPGWERDAGPSASPEDFAPPSGAFLVVYEGERAIAGGGLKRLDEHRVEVKRMFVARDRRGRGVARRLLAALEERAAQRGYEVVRLDTGANQPEALGLYLSAGYEAIEDYNQNPYASHWLEKRVHD